VRSSTALPYRTSEKNRLAFWFVLVGVLAALQYAARFLAGKPSPQVLYEWSTAIGTVVQDGIILGLVLLIAKPRYDLLALRRPSSVWRALMYLAIGLVAIYAFEETYAVITNPGNEQGLTPSHWESAHAAAYIVNALVICTFVPFVEELTYRGLGFSVTRHFGRWPAIFIVGLMFTHAYVRPVWFKCAVVAMPFAAIIVDVSSWYIIKIFHPFAWVEIIAGGLMAASFAVMWFVTMYQLWFSSPPQMVVERASGEISIAG